MAQSGGGGEAYSAGNLVGAALFSAFDFSGRAGLLAYWVIGIAYLVCVSLLCVAFMIWLGPAVETQAGLQLAMKTPEFYGFMLVYLVMSVFRWALEVRRFHDRGVSGLWVLTWFIPIVGPFFMLVQWFKNCFLPGDQGPNQFG